MQALIRARQRGQITPQEFRKQVQAIHIKTIQAAFRTLKAQKDLEIARRLAAAAPRRSYCLKLFEMLFGSSE